MEIEELLRWHDRWLEDRARQASAPWRNRPAGRPDARWLRLAAAHILVLALLTAGSWLLIRRPAGRAGAAGMVQGPEARLSRPFLAPAAGLPAAYAEALR